MIKTYWKWLWYSALTVAISAYLLVIAQLCTPYINSHLQPVILDYVSNKMPTGVNVANIRLGWIGLKPFLILDKVDVQTPKDIPQIKHAAGVQAKIDIFASLLKQQWRLSSLTIQNMTIHIQERCLNMIQSSKLSPILILIRIVGPLNLLCLFRCLNLFSFMMPILYWQAINQLYLNRYYMNV